MIILDGIIYKLQANGGVSVYFDELLKELNRRNCPYLTLRYGQARNRAGSVFRSTRVFERFRSVETPPGTNVFMSSYYRTPSSPTLPSVCTVHDFTYEVFLSGPRVQVHSAQKRAAIRRASDIICVSEATREDLYRFVGKPLGNVHVLHNGVSTEFHPISCQEFHPAYLIFVGHRHRYKNFRVLVEALRYLPKIDLVCVGGESWALYEKSLVKSALKGQLRIERDVSQQRLNQLYNGAVCLIYPSLYEGFGIPVVEAMRAGCPVVACNCRAVKEAGGNALLVAKNNRPVEVAEQIGRALSRERPVIVEAGLQHSAQFSWVKTHTKTVQILERYL